MLCQKCKKNEATAHYTEIINGKRQEMYLCSECAAKQNMNVFGDLPSLFGSMFFGEPKHRRLATGSVRSCPKCGMTLEEIADSGMLGCAECYNAFSEELAPYLTRIHGRATHVGRIPKSAGGELKLRSELNEARESLKKAIDAQEFEQAAKLRDRIKELSEKLGE